MSHSLYVQMVSVLVTTPVIRFMCLCSTENQGIYLHPVSKRRITKPSNVFLPVFLFVLTVSSLQVGSDNVYGLSFRDDSKTFTPGERFTTFNERSNFCRLRHHVEGLTGNCFLQNGYTSELKLRIHRRKCKTCEFEL